MPPRVDPPTHEQAREIPNVTYTVSGTGTPNDGKSADGIVLVDPTTAAPMEPGTITFTSLTISDGADAAEGTTTDSVVQGDAAGTISAKLRGLNKVWGTIADAAWTTGSGTGIALLKAIAGLLGHGQAVMDGSVPVAIASDQSAVPISAASAVPVDASGTTVPTTSVKGTTTFDQKTVTGTATLLLAANPNRISATIQNVSGGSAVVLGNDENVVVATPGEGQYLGLVVVAGGDAEDTDSTSDWYGVSSGSADVRVMEVVRP